MENKYYIPTIEEFHIGFEYEAIVPGLTYGKKVYEGQSLNDYEGEGQGSIQEDIKDGEIRVKCLDKEDIESLGFVYQGIRDYHKRNGVLESGWTKLLEDGSYCDIKCFLDKYDKVDSMLYITSTDIFYPDTHTPWDAYNEGGQGPGCWQINIKNKSELKVLLKQLSINA